MKLGRRGLVAGGVGGVLLFAGLDCCTRVNGVIDQSSANSSNFEAIRNAMETTCLILVHEEDGEGGTTPVSQGSGSIVKFRTDVGDRYFCLTAYHVLRRYLDETQGYKIEILSRNRKGVTFRAFGGTKVVRPVWVHDSKDLGILLLPKEFEIVGSNSSLVRDIPHLKRIHIPDSIRIGTTVRMLGYRHLRDGTFSYVLKEGIIASRVDHHPAVGNAMVFYIDQMANRGMSGGTVFLENGNGLGIVHGYLSESGRLISMSDDLTVVVPYTYFYDILLDVASRGDILR